MTTLDLHIEQIDEENGLPESLSPVWDALAPLLPGHLALYSFDWYRNWFTHYAGPAPWTGGSRTFVVRRGEQPIAILPFAIRRQSGLTILSLAGFYQPLRTWLCTDSDGHASGSAIMNHLQAHPRDWDIIRMSPVDSGPPERATFEQGLQQSSPPMLETELGRTIVHTVKPAFEDYRSSKTFKRIQSYERKFLRIEGARVRHFNNPDAATATDMLADLAHIENHSWLARENGDLRFVSDNDRAFWQAYFGSACRKQSPFNAWIAYLGETPAAFRVVLNSGDIDYMIANQFDEAHGKLRLGWALYLSHLRDAIERRVRLIDSAPGDLHYKGRLGSEEAEMRKNMLFMPNTLKGRTLHSAIRTANATRRALEQQRWGRTLAAKIPQI